MYRKLRKTWEPEGVEWEPNALLGTSVGVGLSQHYRNLRGNVAVDSPEYWAAIRQTALDTLRAGWQDCDLTLEGAEKLVTKGLKVALESPMWPPGKVLLVDESTGVCRPDLVYRDEAGLHVWDVKTARSLDARYVQERLSGYDTLWQLYHNSWEVSQYYGEVVVEAGIMQVVLTPRAQVYLHPVKMEPEHLQQWLVTAEQVWKDQSAEARGERPVIQRYTSCEKRRYGRSRCEFWDACHVHFLDPAKIATTYQRKGE